MNGLNLSDAFLKATRGWEIIEDFNGSAPAGWTAAATSGTVAYDDTGGGVLSLTTQAANNAEGTVTLDAKQVTVIANKPISFAARVQFAEAATDDAQVFVGLTSEAVATALGDSAAGPPADYSGAGLFKVDGGTNWSAEVSLSTAQETVELTALNSLDKVAHAAGSASYQLIEIDILPKTSTKADVIFKIDGSAVYKFADWVYTSNAAMAPVVVVKAGNGGTAEVMKVDLIRLAGVR